MKPRTALILFLTAICSPLSALPTVDVGPQPSHSEAPRRVYALDPLAYKPYRPPWAPLPVIRGRNDISKAALHALASQNPSTRARAAFVLGQVGDTSAVRPLRRMLKDGDGMCRMQAGIALVYMSDESGVPECSHALAANRPEWLRYYAIHAVWAANLPSAPSVLQEASVKGSPLLILARRGALASKPVPFPAWKASHQSTSLTWDQASDMVFRKLIDEADWWFHHGDYDQLIRAQQAAIFLDPTDVDTYGNIAYYQWSLGRESAAVKTLKSAIAAVPDSSLAHYNLGEHYYLIKEYSQALSPLKTSVNLEANTLNCRVYAHALEKTGDFRGALAQWDTLLKMSPSDAAAIRNRERVLSRLNGDK